MTHAADADTRDAMRATRASRHADTFVAQLVDEDLDWRESVVGLLAARGAREKRPRAAHTPTRATRRLVTARTWHRPATKRPPVHSPLPAPRPSPRPSCLPSLLSIALSPCSILPLKFEQGEQKKSFPSSCRRKEGSCRPGPAPERQRVGDLTGGEGAEAGGGVGAVHWRGRWLCCRPNVRGALTQDSC